MSIIIGGSALNSSYYNTAYGVCASPVQTIVPPSDATYVSLVKRVGLDWKIEIHESGDKSKHINYIESLRGNPNVEEAKVLQFVKIAEVVNTKSPTTTKINSPTIDEIKLR
jgi:hypothetical protein